MKFIVFFAVSLVGVPIMAIGASLSNRVRSWLVTALIVATALDVVGNINFVSLHEYRGPDRGFEVSLTDLITWSLLPSLLLFSPGKLRFWPYNTLWMGMFFAISMLGMMLVNDPLYSAFTLWKLLRLYLVYWCISNCLRAGVPMQAVWRGLIAVGVLFIVLCAKQKYLDRLLRVRGPFHHPNGISPYLHIAMPFLLCWGLSERRGSSARVLLSIVVGLGMVFVVVVSQSRAGLLLMLCNVVAVLVLANRWGSSRRVRGVSIIMLILFLAGGIMAADGIYTRFTQAPTSSGEARKELNRAAWMMIEDHPVIGVGLNQYSRVLSVTPDYRLPLVLLAHEEQQGVVHHIYYLTAAETGALGFIVFTIVIGRFWWLSFWNSWLRGSRESLLLSGYVLGATALHLQGLYEWGFRITPAAYMFMIMSAVVVRLAEDVQRQKRRARRS